VISDQKLEARGREAKKGEKGKSKSFFVDPACDYVYTHNVFMHSL
jgi:hypothetical protein